MNLYFLSTVFYSILSFSQVDHSSWSSTKTNYFYINLICREKEKSKKKKKNKQKLNLYLNEL